MVLQKEYRTVLNFAVAEIIERKSRFIASVKPVSTEEEAVAFIDEVRARYRDASHNVYSYYIYGDNIVQRFSDDGEPSGTAGIPVLEVIKRIGVQNLAVVVTRYFGGILLGAAGLVRAYGRSTVLGIDAAVVARKRLCAEISIIIEYGIFGRIQKFLLNGGYRIKKIVYEQDVEIIVFIPVDDVEGFLTMLNEITDARVIAQTGEKTYVTVEEA